MPRISAARRANRRAEVMAAAEACFARLGFHRATMRDVISEAGLSAGCVYTHFRSKDELIAAIAAQRHLWEAEILAKASAAADPVTALRVLARRFLRSSVTPRGRTARRVGMQLWAEALLDPAVHEHVIAGLSVPVDRIAAIIAHGQEVGVLRRSAEPEALARALVALFHGFVLQKLWQPGLRTRPFLAAFDAILDGLVVPKRGR